MSDIAGKVDQHDKEIALLRRDVAGIQTSVSHLAEAADKQTAKLDQIATALHAKGATTMSDIASWLQVLVMAAALITGVVSGIVYVAGNANSVDVALLKYKMERLYGSFGWEPSVRRETKAKD